MKLIHTAAKYFNAFFILLFIGTIAGYNLNPAQAKMEDCQLQNSVNEAIMQISNDVPNVEEEFSEEDRLCLQQNIYFEARNISDLSMRAVAWVTLNRVDSEQYPDNICDVVWQRRQFSWTHDGKSDTPSNNVLDQRAWQRAERITNLVLRNYLMGRESVVGGAMYYHATSVSPSWARQMEQVAQIDNHIFYEN